MACGRSVSVASEYKVPLESTCFTATTLPRQSDEGQICRTETLRVKKMESTEKKLNLDAVLCVEVSEIDSTLCGKSSGTNGVRSTFMTVLWSRGRLNAKESTVEMNGFMELFGKMIIENGVLGDMID